MWIGSIHSDGFPFSARAFNSSLNRSYCPSIFFPNSDGLMRNEIGPENSSDWVNTVPPDDAVSKLKLCNPAMRPMTGGPCHWKRRSEFSCHSKVSSKVPSVQAGCLQSNLDLGCKLHSINVTFDLIAGLQSGQCPTRVLWLKQTYQT